MGISTTFPHIPVHLEWGVFDIFQVPYSAVDRDHEDWIAKVAQSSAGVVFRNGVTPEVSNRWEVFKRVQLDDLMEDGENVSSFMLRFTLAHPFAHTVIVGTTNIKHLRENVGAVGIGPLPESVYYEARQRLDEAGQKSVDA